jgi:hypothetical protein
MNKRKPFDDNHAIKLRTSMNTYQRNIHHKISIDKTYNHSNLKGHEFNKKKSSKKEETKKTNNPSLPT